MIGNVQVMDADFWKQIKAPATVYPTDSERDIRYPNDDKAPHTNISVHGLTELSIGAAIQMAAGYKGKGRGTGGGGTHLEYTIHSRHQRPKRNSQTCLVTQYRHMVGQEGICRY